MRDEKGVSKGFGFVNYERHEDATIAVDAINGSTVGNKKVWTGRAQKKTEREAELRKKFEQIKLDRISKYQGINLYIKNLEDEVNEERLKKEFSLFGEIKSVKIMQDEKTSTRGFGFVCYTTPEEAQRAVTEMNGRILTGCTKPLYVALHEPKEMRRHKLAARHAAGRGIGQKGQGARAAALGGAVGPLYGQAQVYYPPGAPAPQGFAYPPQMIPRGAPGQRGAWQQPYPQQIPANYLMQLQQQQRGGSAGGAPAPAPVTGATGASPAAGPAGAAPTATAGVSAPRGGAAASGRGGAAAANGGRGPRPNARGGAAGAPNDLTLQSLAQFPPEQQKMLLGERLYRLIEKTSHAPLAGKITGMFLDSGWPTDELIGLTQNDDKLNSKIEEAVLVLQRAAAPAQ